MKAVLLILSFVSFFELSAQRVKLSEKEIKEASKVEFKNKNNNRADSSVVRENENIGKKLSEAISKNPDREFSYKGLKIKRVSGEENGVYGADILTLTKQSKFGHIHSLHRILSKYIALTFDYDDSDSDTIAFYTLYYNALHRNEKSYFSEKYITDVIDSLEVEKVGLAQNYKEWSGNSQIVIPLEVNPYSKKVEVTLEELEKEVNPIIEEKKNGPEDREKMEEIIAEKKEKDEKIKKIVEEKKKEEIKKKEEVTKKEEKKDSKSQTESTPKKPEKSGNTEKKVTENPKIDSTDKTSSDSAVKKEDTPPEETKTAMLKEEEKKKEIPEEAKKEIKDLKKENKELKKENKELKQAEKAKEEKSENVMGDKILFLRLVKYEDDGHYTNELWMLDGKNEETIYRSPYTNICGKEYIVIPKIGVLLIGFDGRRPVERIHRLVLLDPDKLAQKTVTKEEIFWRSQIIFRDDKIYAFEKKKDQIYLSRFVGFDFLNPFQYFQPYISFSHY